MQASAKTHTRMVEVERTMVLQLLLPKSNLELRTKKWKFGPSLLQNQSKKMQYLQP